jgi:hypothetical protein
MKSSEQKDTAKIVIGASALVILGYAIWTYYKS